MKKVLLALVLIMAVLVVNGQAAQTTTKEKPVRTPVMVADLQKTITDNIAKDYVGFTVKEATKVMTKGVETFEVVVVKGTVTERLEYDNAGKFMKKLPPPPKK